MSYGNAEESFYPCGRIKMMCKPGVLSGGSFVQNEKSTKLYFPADFSLKCYPHKDLFGNLMQFVLNGTF